MHAELQTRTGNSLKSCGFVKLSNRVTAVGGGQVALKEAVPPLRAVLPAAFFGVLCDRCTRARTQHTRTPHARSRHAHTHATRTRTRARAHSHTYKPRARAHTHTHVRNGGKASSE